jgi:hypothetical protein
MADVAWVAWLALGVFPVVLIIELWLIWWARRKVAACRRNRRDL